MKLQLTYKKVFLRLLTSYLVLILISFLLFRVTQSNRTIIYIIVSIFSVILAALLTNSIKDSIASILSVISSIRYNNFIIKDSEIDKNNWFPELVQSIKYLSEEIEKNIDFFKSSQEELNIIVDNIDASLLLIDLEGRVVFANSSLKRLVNISDLTNKFYWEIFRERDINKFFKELINNPKNLMQELTIKGVRYLCSVTYLPKRRRLILIFQDLSPIEEVKRVKKDIVANVSHELRTPLTTIKGYLETLLDEDLDDDKKYFLKIIEKNTNRLCSLVNELLILSELENKKELTKHKIEISRLLDEIKELFVQRLIEKDLKLKISIDSQITYIYADEFKLQQLFINLIDNAIKYSKKGNIFINIEKLSHGGIKIIIKDEGIGIPKEHLPYIFERFYVVDKSRSRQTGGSGLGLSIVKHIVKLYGGMIEVKSKPKKGTIFTIFLPDIDLS